MSNSLDEWNERMVAKETGRDAMGFTGTKRSVQYHACALDEDGRIGMLLVVRENGRCISEEWTGETFPNTRHGQDACNALMSCRNSNLI